MFNFKIDRFQAYRTYISLFQDSFYEGKDLAEQSEILELPANANPEEYYYGEGRDFEQQQQSWLSDSDGIGACDPRLAEALRDVFKTMNDNTKK